MKHKFQGFIAHNLDNLPNNTEVESWPLHLTLTPPFTHYSSLGLDQSQLEIQNIIQEAGREVGPIQLEYGQIRSGSIPLEIGNEAMYGPNYDIPVVEVLDPSDKLHRLHNQVIKKLAEIGCNFVDLQWALDNYSPHATTRKDRRLERPFMCDSLTVNEWHNKSKKVGKTVFLGSN